jgi:peptidyl-prolyl cis-trans isomerase A (cyclophilin A)
MRRIYLALLLAALAFVLGSGCGSSSAPSVVNVPVVETRGTPAPVASEQKPSAPPAKHRRDILLDPNQATLRAPDTFGVRFETSRGDIAVRVIRSNAPLGADRLYNLVVAGFYDEARFFRVVAGFVAQFGIHAEPAITNIWRDAKLADDPVVASNVRGTLSFASAGPNTRTTQLFFNLVDNTRLDAMGFTPVGEIISGREVLDAIHTGYAGAPMQPRIESEGNAYLEADFPLLDYVRSATIEP